jgi:putative hydrolase of HD superfamily
MNPLMEFAAKVAELKRLKRTGWVIKGVKAPESVADHSFMLAVLAYVYSKNLGLDSDKCVRMALLHDICEVYAGDIPNRVRKKDKPMPDGMKRKLEKDGLEKIIATLPEGLADEIREFWNEFEAGKSREAELVKDLDKLEMCMQALAYAKAEKNAKARNKFAEFFEDGRLNIKTPEMKRLFRRLYAEFERQ